MKTQKEFLDRIVELENALKPFAAMHRVETNEDEDQMIAKRGTASDMSCIFGGDFRRAYHVLNESKSIPEIPLTKC